MVQHVVSVHTVYVHTNVYEEAQSGGPSIFNAKLVEKMNENIREKHRFPISELSLKFHQISRICCLVL